MVCVGVLFWGYKVGFGTSIAPWGGSPGFYAVRAGVILNLIGGVVMAGIFLFVALGSTAKVAELFS